MSNAILFSAFIGGKTARNETNELKLKQIISQDADTASMVDLVTMNLEYAAAANMQVASILNIDTNTTSLAILTEFATLEQRFGIVRPPADSIKFANYLTFADGSCLFSYMTSSLNGLDHYINEVKHAA